MLFIVVDLVVLIPVRTGSVPKTIGRYLSMSADTLAMLTDSYKSSSVSFELYNC